jgi:hypothetical protein
MEKEVTISALREDLQEKLQEIADFKEKVTEAQDLVQKGVRQLSEIQG